MLISYFFIIVRLSGTGSQVVTMNFNVYNQPYLSQLSIMR